MALIDYMRRAIAIGRARSADEPMSEPPKARRFLPAPGSLRYHLLLGAVALLVLGPLGGVTAAYMNFSLGFSVGGQVLAGILGSSVVTYGYGAEGKHGANYIQTMAASVAVDGRHVRAHPGDGLAGDAAAARPGS